MSAQRKWAIIRPLVGCFIKQITVVSCLEFNSVGAELRKFPDIADSLLSVALVVLPDLGNDKRTLLTMFFDVNCHAYLSGHTFYKSANLFGMSYAMT